MERSCFSEKTLTLSVLTAEFARCVLQTGAPVTARSFLLRGLPMTLALVLITALTAGAEQRADSFLGTDLRSRVVCGGLGLWFVWEAVETFRQAQELCWGNFSSMAMLGLLPLLLWAGWKLEPSVLVRCAPILCWAAALTVLLCLLGLNGQFHWESLMMQADAQTIILPLYPEYFALPLFCPAKQVRYAVWLPVKAFILAGSFALCTELVFGAGNALPGIELLRQMVHDTGAHSTDLQSPESVDHLCDKCGAYAADWQPVADEIWSHVTLRESRYENYKDWEPAHSTAHAK